MASLYKSSILSRSHGASIGGSIVPVLIAKLGHRNHTPVSSWNCILLRDNLSKFDSSITHDSPCGAHCQLVFHCLKHRQLSVMVA